MGELSALRHLDTRPFSLWHGHNLTFIRQSEGFSLFEGKQKFRAFGSWKGLTAVEGDLTSSFSNLRLSFSAPVADGGQPGLTTPEELLLGSAITGWCTAFMATAEQMALDVARVEIEGELTRDYDEIDGVQLKALALVIDVQLRTGIGFEKVHDMFRRAAGLAQHRSPVLKALAAVLRLKIEANFSEAK